MLREARLRRPAQVWPLGAARRDTRLRGVPRRRVRSGFGPGPNAEGRRQGASRASRCSPSRPGSCGPARPGPVLGPEPPGRGQRRKGRALRSPRPLGSRAILTFAAAHAGSGAAVRSPRPGSPPAPLLAQKNSWFPPPGCGAGRPPLPHHTGASEVQSEKAAHGSSRFYFLHRNKFTSGPKHCGAALVKPG